MLGSSDSGAREKCPPDALLGCGWEKLNSWEAVEALEASDMRENLVIREDRDDRCEFESAAASNVNM